VWRRRDRLDLLGRRELRPARQISNSCARGDPMPMTRTVEIAITCRPRGRPIRPTFRSLHKQNAGGRDLLARLRSRTAYDIEVTTTGHVIGHTIAGIAVGARLPYVDGRRADARWFRRRNRRGETRKISGHYWVPIDDAATMVSTSAIPTIRRSVTLDDAVAYETDRRTGSGRLVARFPAEEEPHERTASTARCRRTAISPASSA